MKVALFYHSLISDWNHGNAHFLRGVASELIALGHKLTIYEPVDGWSLQELKKEKNVDAANGFRAAYPALQSRFHNGVDWQETIGEPDLIIAHEWNSHALIESLGQFRKSHPRTRLLFHDTHHRAITSPEEMEKYNLTEYDGVLAYGEVLRELYCEKGWVRQAWTWHEAADLRVFHPLPEIERTGDLVWIGNWGDGERTNTLREFLLQPVRELALQAEIFGVRYPQKALDELAAAHIDYGGWLPNFQVPEVFARFKVTVHVPRGPYVSQLPGIPTIRPFEAMACGIPLVSAPWNDSEGLFRKNVDYLAAENGLQMQNCLRAILNDETLANDLANSGRETILQRHTCAHRVEELLRIFHSV